MLQKHNSKITEAMEAGTTRIGQVPVLAVIFLLVFTVAHFQGYCHPGYDTTAKILRGDGLRNRSPVSYYYNLLLQSAQSGKIPADVCPAIVYSSAWDEWIVDSVTNDEGAIVSPKFTHSQSKEDDGTGKDYTDFLNRSRLIVKVSDDVINITTWNSGNTFIDMTIQIKLFFDRGEKPVLGVSYSITRRNAATQGRFYFFAPGNNGWPDITASVIKLPDTSAYFGKTINTKLVRKYDYVGVDMAFTNSDTIGLRAFKSSDLNCEDNSEPYEKTISKTNRQQLCKLFDEYNSGADGFTNNSINYVFDKDKSRFIRINGKKP